VGEGKGLEGVQLLLLCRLDCIPCTSGAWALAETLIVCFFKACSSTQQLLLSDDGVDGGFRRDRQSYG